MNSFVRKIGFIAGPIAWPFVLFMRALHNTLLHGKAIRKKYSYSMRRQLLDQIILGLVYGRPPHTYYMYGFYNYEHKSQAKNYITPQEFRGLVESSSDMNTTMSLNDKLRFEKSCEDAGLPCVNTKLVIYQGKFYLPTGALTNDLPNDNFFIKPVSSHGGKGCMLYLLYKSGYRDYYGNFFSHQDLTNYLKYISRKQKLLIQPYLRNHSYIEKYLGISTLSTIRVLSANEGCGNVHILRAIFKMPISNMIVDNLGAGAIGCPVDLIDGRLKPGYIKKSAIPIISHPDHNFLFTSVQLPFWKDVIELATKAHVLFSGNIFAGWDIAITEKGCILVEGNSFPAVESMQQAHGPLLNDKVFYEICINIGMRSNCLN